MAILLDVHITRINNLRGQHFRLGLRSDKKDRSDIAMSGPYADIDNQHSHASLPRPSDAFEVPTAGYGAKHTRAGYSVPSSQFDYETGYHGAHAERVLGGK